MGATHGSSYGAGEIFLTSMDQDGRQNGYDLALTAAVSECVQIPVIASGGVGTLEHLYDGLVKGKADAVLAASIFHFRDPYHSTGEELFARTGRSHSNGVGLSETGRDVEGQSKPHI